MNEGNNNDQLGDYKDIIEEYENCCITIKKIEENIEQKYKEILYKNSNINIKCILIELNEYKEYKEKINFQIFKDDIQNYKDKMVMKLVTEKSIEPDNKDIKLEKLKTTKLNSINDLSNYIFEINSILNEI